MNGWQGFLGESRDTQKPLFFMRRTPSLLIHTKNLAAVYVCLSAKRNKKKAHSDYRVEGCYAKHSFTLLNNLNELIVAEVKPKQVRSEITLGTYVFNLTEDQANSHIYCFLWYFCQSFDWVHFEPKILLGNSGLYITHIFMCTQQHGSCCDG